MKAFFIALLCFLVIMLFIFIYSKYPVTSLLNQSPVPSLPNTSNTVVDISTSKPYGQWTWEYSIDLQGQKSTPKDSSDFILTLTPEGRLTTTTDCNSVSGSFVTNENTLTIGALVSTKKACKENSFETHYITFLSLASSYQVSDDTLTLYLAQNSGSMTFSRR
jgi:heat shock protein HslJ